VEFQDKRVVFGILASFRDLHGCLKVLVYFFRVPCPAVEDGPQDLIQIIAIEMQGNPA